MIVIIGVGMVMLPMNKVLTHPRHTVGGIEIPLTLVIKNRGIGDRTVIGYGITGKFHYCPGFLRTIKIGDRKRITIGLAEVKIHMRIPFGFR
jgi:hypothetical protein